MMKKILWIISCIIVSVSTVTGKYAGAFLDIGVGGRAIALGGAYTAVPGDPFAFYWNPAGLGTLHHFHMIAQHAKLFNGLESHNVIGITRPIFGGNFISLNWIRLTVPDIARYDSDNLVRYGPNGWSRRVQEEASRAETLQELIDLGTVLTDPPLGYSDFTNDAFYITFTKMNFYKIDFGWQYFVLPVEMPIGINFKILRQSLFNNSASGVGVDLGWMLRFGMNDLLDNPNLGQITFGAMLKDVWKTRITWNTATNHSDIIERGTFLGVSYLQPLIGLNSSLLFSYDYHNKYGRSNHFGVEYFYQNKLALRVGLDDGLVTAGVGIRFWVLDLDYSYMGHDLGNSHRISLTLGL